MSRELRRVYEELAKFARVLEHGDLKKLVSDALQPGTEAKYTLPLKSKSPTLIRAFCAAVVDKKYGRHGGPLVSAFCDFTLTGGVRSEALVAALHAIMLFSQTTDAEYALKVIQFAATSLPQQYSDRRVLSATFSVCLALCDHPVSVVSMTAFATSQQMISMFFGYVLVNGNTLGNEDATDVALGFSRPLWATAYLLLSDIVAIIVENPRVWLNVNIPVSIAFRVWEMVIMSQKEFLLSNSKFTELIESSVVMPIMDAEEIPFLVTLVTEYISVLPIICVHVFSYCLGGLNSDTRNTDQFVAFFDAAFARRASLAADFYEQCNKDGSLVHALLENLDQLADKHLTTVTGFGYHSARDGQSDRSILLRTGPVEIVDRIVASLETLTSRDSIVAVQKQLWNDTQAVPVGARITEGRARIWAVSRANMPRHNSSRLDPSFSGIDMLEGFKYTQLVELIWPRLLSIVIKGVRYADAESVNWTFLVFRRLIMVASNMKLSEAQAIMLRVLCGLVAKQTILKENVLDLEVSVTGLLHENKKGLFFKAKRVKAYEVLIGLLYSAPQMFFKMFRRTFLTIASFSNNKLDPSFTTRMSTMELSRCCKALVKGNSFCLDFLANVLTVNAHVFGSMFRLIAAPLMERLDDDELRKSAYALIIKVSASQMISMDESIFLPLFAAVLTRDDVLIEDRFALLNQIKFLVLSKGGTIYRGWNFILSSISLVHGAVDGRVILIGARILSTICNNHISKMDRQDMKEIVDLIFQFGFQKVNINISLTSVDLLWVVIPSIREQCEFWKLILNKTMALTYDDRIDVAICAVRTFFSLLVSNVDQLPSTIYVYLINDIFVPEVRRRVQFSEDLWPVEQLLFQELCQCAVSFWKYFAGISDFEDAFWPSLIARHEDFLAQCRDQEVKAYGFQFYDVAFPCISLRSDTRYVLTKSYASVIDEMLTNEPPVSLVLASMGRFVHQAMTSQKPFMTVDLLALWLDIVADMCRKLRSEAYINLSAKKGLSAALALLPLPYPMTRHVSNGLIGILSTSLIPSVREETCNLLCVIFAEHCDRLDFFEDCGRIMTVVEARPLLEKIADYPFATTDPDRLFCCLLDLSISALSSFAHVRLLDLLPVVSDDRQRLFIRSLSRDVKGLTEIWSRFFDPASPHFSDPVYRGCFSSVLRAIGELLQFAGDEDVLVELLRFLDSAGTPANPHHPELSDCFLFDVAAEILSLVDDPRRAIQTISRSLLLKMRLRLALVLA